MLLWITDNTCRIFVKDTKWLFPSRLVSFDCHFLLQGDYSRPLVARVTGHYEKWRREKNVEKFIFIFELLWFWVKKEAWPQKWDSLSRNGEAGQHFYKYPCPPREYVCMCIYTLSLRGWVNNFSFLWEMGELFVWGGPPLFTQWAKQTDSRASSYRLAAPRKSWTQKVSCGQQLPFWFESNHTVLSLSFIFSFS